MRVLHLPNNIASQISISVRALRDIGIEARGLAPKGLITSNDVIEPLLLPTDTQRVRRLISNMQQRAKILRAIYWSDVVHWHFHWSMAGAMDVKWAKQLRKKRIVEFWGSDIRIPEIESADNPYYAAAHLHSEYRSTETLEKSRLVQSTFASLGAIVLVPDGQMKSYIQADLIAKTDRVRQRIYLPDYEPIYPSSLQDRPVILHSPSASVMKGTAFVKASVAKLQKSHKFDFKLLQGVPHHEAKCLIQSCDIFVDQFVLGAHGLAALEAMAYGKPVVCYIKPAMLIDYPASLPIVNATQETLTEVLAELLEDPSRRHELGRQGRAYVEKYHDAHKLAQQLVDIYKA